MREICWDFDGEKVCIADYSDENKPQVKLEQIEKKLEKERKKQKRKEEKMVIISVHVTPKMLEVMDNLVKQGYYANRSELIRAAISEFLTRWYGHAPED